MSESQVDMDVVVAKIIALLIITTISVLCGLFPCRLFQFCAQRLVKKKRTLDYMISSLKCFSGGIFLGVCFLHLLPDTRLKFGEMLTQIRSHSEYPVAELLTMAGFFGVIFTEHGIRSLYKKLQEITDRERSEWNDSEILPTSHSEKLDGSELDDQSINSFTKEDLIQSHETHDKSFTSSEKPNKDDLDIEIEPAPLQDLEVKKVVSELSRGGESSKGQMRSALFITALSFHGIFEGMVLGLQSVESNAWTLCFAIGLHRGILAFAMGLQHMRNEEKHSTMIFSISSFSLLAAVGIIIGLVISTGAQLYVDVNVPNAILQSIATGTLFYIIFFDILFKELDGNKDVKKMSCVFVGFSVMAIIFAVTRH
ncbi:hypothetical protein FSP39_000460 [Pinctada imbricata]|uniref:Zinc transporter ZIP3 n=1 Tax=Pinctada imbricata TaxID=66713 RepID=A0AA89BZI9_PINIB|nr:hypothetical protein FSP39_000460 [Pinctada imbricata]